jgi:pectate lyase
MSWVLADAVKQRHPTEFHWCRPTRMTKLRHLFFITALIATGCGGGGGGDSEEESPLVDQTSNLPEQGAALPEPGPLPILSDEVRIFPGAEGFGTKSVGGRGGELCFVTNTNNDGEGSFRHCAEASGNRIVIFRTGGTIIVDEPIHITEPYISIYGQTAPGDGVLIRASLNSIGPVIRIQTHDVLMQHMRIRAGSSREITCCRDAIAIGKAGNVYNVVLDHNSFTWGIDEILDIWYDSHDITLSHNIIAESLHDNGSNSEGPGGRGMLIGSTGAHSISIHHNYIAHSYQRNPLIKTTGIIDITSNLIYHHVTRGAQHDDVYGGQKINWVKNRYIPLLGNENEYEDTVVGWGDILLIRSDSNTGAYFEGNLGHHRTSNSDPEWAIAHTSWGEPYDPSLGYHSDTRFPAPPITETAADDLETVIPATAGALLPIRSPVDARLFDQLAQRQGRLLNCVEQADRPGDSRCENNAGGWPSLDVGTPPVDTDQDGIPDDWEASNGMDPNTYDSHLDLNGDNYTNLEAWIFRTR